MAAFDKKQMDAMVNRFLGWKLPPTFGPDAGVKFTPSNGMTREEAYEKGWWPVGTNLLTADEARAMLEHVLDVTFIPDWSLLEATQASLREHMAMMKELRAQIAAAQAVADHLFIDARGDGPWLVCVEKVFDTEDQARTACRKWQAATGGVTAFQPLAPAHVADPRGPEFTRINQHDAIVHPAGVMEALPCAIPTWQEQQEQHDPEHDFAQDKWMQDEIDALRAAMRTRGVPATPPDNRTRPLTDQSQPWTPEHCKTYPRRAAEEIEYLRGQLATLGVMASDGSQR